MIAAVRTAVIAALVILGVWIAVFVIALARMADRSNHRASRKPPDPKGGEKDGSNDIGG